MITSVVVGANTSGYYTPVNKIDIDSTDSENWVAVIDGEVATLCERGSQEFYDCVRVQIQNKKKNKRATGYVKKSVVDSLSLSSVPIPQNFAGLEAIDVPTQLEYQLFRIYEVIEGDDYVEVSARHVWYDNLQNYTLWEPEENTNYTGAAVCRHILTNAVSAVNSRVASDCTDEKPWTEFDYERKNLTEAFLDPENGVCAKYGLNLIRDNWDFYCLKDVGYNRGFVVEDNKNLLGVERKESLENTSTRVAPIGRTDKGELVWLDNNGLKYVDSTHINDYGYPRVEIFDTGLQIGKNEVTAENINEKLLAAAQKRFTDDKVDLPTVEMTIEFLSLGDTEEYVQYRGLDKVYLYDVITVKDKQRGYSYSAQVVGIEYDILTGMMLSVKIGKLDNWDGTRKIATWQVPEVDGSNIRLQTIKEGSFAPGAINAGDIAVGGVQWVHFDAASIDQLTTQQFYALQANIHQLIAGSITADDIQANSIRAAIIEAGKITADDIQAETITAALIDTNQLNAINAKLGTATVTNGYIDNAYMNFANIKAATAESLIARDAVTDKYYIDKLAVNNAQMVYATVGELVVKADNNKYYRLDINSQGQLTPVEVTLTAGEITAGVTRDGKASIIETDLSVTDLSASNMKGITALIDKLTASRIDVDELWSREAFIGKLNVTDISSNTYIQATIGNWTSGSTITQTINSLDSRISSLGYGTVFMQPDEPSHSGLVSGDIWVQTMTSGTWQSVYDEYTSWDHIYQNVDSWQVLGSIPKMFVWDGQGWQEMYDAYLPSSLQTEIEQLADAITLKASKDELNLLSGQITEFNAELTIMADEITSAVSTVNAKAATYIQWEDPRIRFDVSLGDIWIKRDTRFNDDSTWNEVYNDFTSWNDLYTSHDKWDDTYGDRTYIWNGDKWVESSDRAAEIYQKTLIDQSSTQIKLLAETSATLGNEIIHLSSSLTVANDRITAEVSRAVGQEQILTQKTRYLQTSGLISLEAFTPGLQGTALGLLTIAGITIDANGKIDITALTAYSQNAINKSASITVDANGKIVLSALDNGVQGAINKAAGITVDANGKIILSAANFDHLGNESGNTIYISPTEIKIKSQGQFKVESSAFFVDSTASNIIMWAGYFSFNTSTNYTAGQIVEYGGNLYRFTTNHSAGAWNASQVVQVAWGSQQDSSPFRVTKSGNVYLTKLIYLDEQGNESTVNLRTANLWKLNYATIKSYTTSDGYCTQLTLSNAINGSQTINFRSAAAVRLVDQWTGGILDAQYNVETTNTPTVQRIRFALGYASVRHNAETHKYSVPVTAKGTTVMMGTDIVDATAEYEAGINDGWKQGWEGYYDAMVTPTRGYRNVRRPSRSNISDTEVWFDIGNMLPATAAASNWSSTWNSDTQITVTFSLWGNEYTRTFTHAIN